MVDHLAFVLGCHTLVLAYHIPVLEHHTLVLGLHILVLAHHVLVLAHQILVQAFVLAYQEVEILAVAYLDHQDTPDYFDYEGTFLELVLINDQLTKALKLIRKILFVFFVERDDDIQAATE